MVTEAAPAPNPLIDKSSAGTKTVDEGGRSVPYTVENNVITPDFGAKKAASTPEPTNQADPPVAGDEAAASTQPTADVDISTLNRDQLMARYLEKAGDKDLSGLGNNPQVVLQTFTDSELRTMLSTLEKKNEDIVVTALTNPENQAVLEEALEDLNFEELDPNNPEDQQAVEDAITNAEVKAKGITPEEAKKKYNWLRAGLQAIGSISIQSVMETNVGNFIAFMTTGHEAGGGNWMKNQRESLEASKERGEVAVTWEEMRKELNDPEKFSKTFFDAYFTGKSNQPAFQTISSWKEGMSEDNLNLLKQKPDNVEAYKKLIAEILDVLFQEDDEGSQEAVMSFRTNFASALHGEKKVYTPLVLDKLKAEYEQKELKRPYLQEVPIFTTNSSSKPDTTSPPTPATPTPNPTASQAAAA